MGRILPNRTPIYTEYSCPLCIFVGTYEYRDLGDTTRQTDLYFHGDTEHDEDAFFGNTILGVYSNEIGDNTSGIWAGQGYFESGVMEAPLAKAYELCKAYGWITVNRNRYSSS